MGPLVLDDPVDESVRLVKLADGQGIPLRLLGGVAFRVRCAGGIERPPGAGRDLDMITSREHRRSAAAMLVAEGYVPDRHYNALNGHRQMYFMDASRDRPVDVLVDRLAMCHTLELRERMMVDYPTIPLADLLLSKLQIKELNEKDVVDVLALLRDFDLGDADTNAVNVRRIAEITSHDWGWWRTVTGNLATLHAFITHSEVKHRSVLLSRLDALSTSIDGAPKSPRWRLRARIGERVRWYEQPEEVEHD
jgi:hypothetical protein